MRNTSKHISNAWSVFALAAAVLILASYSFNISFLKPVLYFDQVKFNTTICILLSAVNLLLINSKPSQIKNNVSRFLSFLVLLIAGISLSQYIFSWNAGIDQLLHKAADSNPEATIFPGRMRIGTSFTLIVLNLIFLVLAKKKWHLPIQIILISGALLGGLTFVVVAALLFEIKNIMFLRPFLHSSFIFMALFTATFFSAPLGYLKFSFHKKIAGYFAIVALLMSFLFMAIGTVNKQTDATSKQISVSNQILLQNQKILNFSQSMEISTRGFLLTGKEIFLDGINKFTSQLQDATVHLQKIDNQTSLQKLRADSLANQIAHNIKVRGQLIELRKAKGLEGVNNLFETEIVQNRMMRQVYNLTDAIEKEEKKLLEKQKADHEKNVAELSRIIYLFYFILMVLLLTSFWIIYKNTRARNKAEQEIKDLNATLESRVEHKTSQVIEKEKQYRFLLENMREGIQIISHDWHYLFVNNSLIDQSRYTNEELIGFSMLEKYPGIQQTAMFKEMEKCMRERKPQLLENEFTYPDNSKRFFELSIQPVPEGLFVLSMDITERKKAEAEKNRLLDTIEKSLNEIYVFHPDSLLFQYVNHGALQNLGYDKNEIYGLTVLDIKPEVTEPSFRKLLKPLINGEKEKIIFETSHKRKDGSTYPAESHLQLIEQGNQKVFLAVVLDVTESKQAEEIKKQLNEALEKRATELLASNSELERFAYVASHDLQEPLRMVSSFLQLLEKKLGGKLDETGKRYIDFAVDGAERMKKLIHDLLEYSRVGSIHDSISEIDLNEVLSTVKNIYRARLEETKGSLDIKPMPGIIKAVKPQIQQVFQNLVGNALKYRNSNPPVIEMGCKDVNDRWEFYVKDNGIGIEPKFFDKIFIVFQRLHGTGEYSGTGIGLSICKKIINRHGGNIWVESVPGEGSTFYFTISKTIS